MRKSRWKPKRGKIRKTPDPPGSANSWLFFIIMIFTNASHHGSDDPRDLYSALETFKVTLYSARKKSNLLVLPFYGILRRVFVY